MAPLVLTVSADLPLDAREYFMERDGAAFRAFMCDEMDLLAYEIVECWREGQATLIKLSSKPDVSSWMPDALASKFPDLEYQDVVRYDPHLLAQPPYELHVHSVAPFLGDKGRFSSRIWIEPLGQDRCRHTLEQTIELKGLFGLGAVAKKLAKKSLQDSFDEMPEIMERRGGGGDRGWKGLREELLATLRGRERLLAGRPKVQGVEWMEQHVAALKQHGVPRHKHKRRSAAPQPDQPPAPAVSPEASGAASAAAPPPSAFAGATPAGRAVQEEVVQAGSPSREEGQAGADALEQQQAERQDTGRTQFWTPAASPMPSASEEVQAQVAAAAPPADADGDWSVQAVRGDTGGRPLQAVADGLPVGAEGCGSSSLDVSRPGSAAASYSADRSESVESSSEGREDWSSLARWRAYFRQHGHTPLKRAHTLPPKLVSMFVVVRRVTRVKVQKVGGAVGSSGSRGGLKARVQAAIKSCTGGRTTATE